MGRPAFLEPVACDHLESPRVWWRLLTSRKDVEHAEVEEVSAELKDRVADLLASPDVKFEAVARAPAESHRSVACDVDLERRAMVDSKRRDSRRVGTRTPIFRKRTEPEQDNPRPRDWCRRSPQRDVWAVMDDLTAPLVDIEKGLQRLRRSVLLGALQSGLNTE